ncbi:RNA polymerase subunit beta (plastid) [Nitzschia inconspicua]|uniref:DNA-directed RNA polymerase n=1 Tax=Nitzschia inconspicua TaxID=303405 RepID=A0A8H2SIA6_9STRA|nr:RNA polymerase subunit beta [Nitzschia inconspicua]
MTTYATFIINGCERVIVSQIIRSPGIYFEKNKNQKVQNQFRRKLSVDIHKLRTFLPSGEAFIAEFDLFFQTQSRINKNFKNNKIVFLLQYFQFLIHTLKKYKILQELSNEFSFQNDLQNLTSTSKLSVFQKRTLLQIYQKTVVVSQLASQLEINSKPVLVIEQLSNWLFQIQNFSLLKQNILKTLKSIKDLKPFLNFSSFRPILYFSTSFKEQFQYFGSEFELVQSADDIDRYISAQGYSVTKPRGKNKTSKYARRVSDVLKKQHKYLKSKTQLLLYQKDYEIKTNYQKKYSGKELYTATLIPEYGSWIRFNFQKNTNLNPYKYPLKNQEDELIIQLDKLTQKPILLLLKEMGFTDLEIYQNLYHSDFFYFQKPVLINSRHLQQPIPRFEFDIDYFENLSEFSQIFDPTYFRVGKIGRARLNHRLNLKMNDRLQSITYEDLFAIIDKLISLTISKSISDDIDHTSSELALGQNILVAYMPWQGYNFEDAILISERLVYDDIFTSIHIERYKIEINRNTEMSEQLMKMIPNATPMEIKHLNEDGVVTIGTFVRSGDILVGKVISNNTSEQLPESKLLRAIFGAKSKGIKDNSYRMPHGESGRVIETITFNRKTKLNYECDKIYIFIAQIRKIQVGDKIAGRHGNKGIISRILGRQDMPFLPDGTPIDIILNPLGVPSRMNVGQLYECLLGLAGDRLNCRFKILPFDEMYGLDISRILINKKLRQASIKKNKSWLFNPYAPGKMVLVDGRTGKEFENPITVGNAYMLKLIHLVDDKMHARATGPYSLITQQPLRGKAQHGGQRFGEMEVWALEGFGAAFTLKEILTVKSDDMQGRNETLNAIVKGQQLPQFGVPESFKVLLQELRSIGLDMSTYKIEKFSSFNNYETEINLIEKYNPLSKTFLPTSNLNDISF